MKRLNKVFFSEDIVIVASLTSAEIKFSQKPFLQTNVKILESVVKPVRN